MSQFYAPGASQLFCGSGASGAYQFLGLARSEVRLDINASFEDVQADFAGGGSVPADVSYLGESATISFDLAWYNESVLLALMKRAVLTANVAGTMSAPTTSGQGVGTLMATEGVAVGFCIKCPAVAKAAFSGMIPCFTFGVSWLDGNLSTPLGVKVKYPRVVIRAIPSWTPSTGVGVLYTNTLPSGLPSVA